MRRLLAVTFGILSVTAPSANVITPLPSGELMVAPPRATAPLSLTAVLPRFLRPGDVASIGAIVTNGGPDCDAVVSIISLDPIALKFDDASSQLVHLASGASETVRFVTAARNAGAAHVRISAAIGRESVSIDATQTILRPSGVETVAASGDTNDRAAARIDLPRDIEPNVGGLTITLGSSPLVELGESIRFLDELPYDSAEHASSRAIALIVAADLGSAIDVPEVAAADYRARAAAALANLAHDQCPNGGFAFWPEQCTGTNAYLTSYALHALKRGGVLGLSVDQAVVERAIAYLQHSNDPEPTDPTWLAWVVSRAYAAKTLAEFGRPVASDLSQLIAIVDRLPPVALSAVADALASTNDRGTRYQDVTRRLIAALQVSGDQAHVEGPDAGALAGIWQSDVSSTATVLEGVVRRKDDAAVAAKLAIWLLAARHNERWATSHEDAACLEALAAYDRGFTNDASSVSAIVTLGSSTVGKASFNGRAPNAHTLTIPMPELVKLIAANPARDFVIARSSGGHVFYETRLQYLALSAPAATEHGLRLTRVYDHIADDGTTVLPASAAFVIGDLIRVRLSITLTSDQTYLAIIDPLLAGVDVVQHSFRPEAIESVGAGAMTSDTALSTRTSQREGLDRFEQHADDVTAFATRLTTGTHECSYLVRATTSGNFAVGGAHAEAMFQPSVDGRTAGAALQIK